jgi:hypothetical protein
VEIIKYIELVGHMGEIQEDVTTVEEKEMLERRHCIYIDGEIQEDFSAIKEEVSAGKER